MKKNILSWLGSVGLCLAVGMGAAGCANELDPGFDHADLGEKVKGTLSVPLGSSSPDTATRGRVDFSQNAMVKIDNYWIGVFDAETHELLGTKYDEHPRKSDGTRYTINNGDSTPFTVDGIEIEYYERSPYAYILGVVNYAGVLAKEVGEEEAVTPLIDMLKAAKTFEEVSKIVVDIDSAEKANPNESDGYAKIPLMMGYYSTAKTFIHPQLKPDGSIYVSSYPDMMGGTGGISPSEVRVSLVGNGVDLNLTGGAIRLQRMMAEVNVYVMVPNYYYYGGNNTSTGYLSVESMRYRVRNKPKDMYLMERATSEYAREITDKDKYLNETANSADFTDNYQSDDSWTYVYSSYYDNQNSATVYYFTYQHYETKHYGQMFNDFPLDGSNFHSVREARYLDETTETGFSDVLRMLCPSMEQPWNNNASYIELEVTYGLDFTDTWWNNDDYRNNGAQYKSGGTVVYTIHEGCTSWVDGQAYPSNSTAAVGDPKMRDFQTIRNTQYHYQIRLGGAEGLKINVDANDFDDDKKFHNDGLTGSVWYTNLDYIDNSSSVQYFELGSLSNETRKSLEWVYALYNPSGYGRVDYWGTFTGEFSSTRTGTGTSSYYSNYIPVSISGYGTLYLYSNNLKDPEDVTMPMPENALDAVRIYKGTYYTYGSGPSQKYPNNITGEYKTLKEFIELDDDDPFLVLEKAPYGNSDQIFWYGIVPWRLSGDDINYDRYSNYEQMFCIFTPERTDADGCTMQGNTQQFVQRPYDDRQSLGYFYGPDGYYNHDYGIGGIHDRSYYYNFNNNYQTYWCGAPGTVSWFYVEQYYNSSDPDMDVPDYDIKIGNQTFTVKSEDIFVDYTYSRYKYLRIPLYIPENFSSYGFLTVTFTPKPDLSKYRPASSVTYENSIYMQRKARYYNSGSWQWLLANVSESTYGYGKIWEFYNFEDHIQSNFEYGGLTVICNKSDKAITTARHPLYDGDTNSSNVDCLNFSGGYSTGGAPARGNDQMLMKFWIDRPGDVYLSYGYEKSGTNREWRAYWRAYDGTTRSTNYLHWAPDESKFGLIIPEEKGVPNTGTMEEFWPDVDPNTGKFVDGPIEVLIYMASSSGYIRSIEFEPYTLY